MINFCFIHWYSPLALLCCLWFTHYLCFVVLIVVLFHTCSLLSLFHTLLFNVVFKCFVVSFVPAVNQSCMGFCVMYCVHLLQKPWSKCAIVHLVGGIIMYTIYQMYRDVASPRSLYGIFLECRGSWWLKEVSRRWLSYHKCNENVSFHRLLHCDIWCHCSHTLDHPDCRNTEEHSGSFIRNTWIQTQKLTVDRSKNKHKLLISFWDYLWLRNCEMCVWASVMCDTSVLCDVSEQ